MTSFISEKWDDIDTLNRFGVAAQTGNSVTLLMPPRPAQSILHEQALVLAAYLAALADPVGERFAEVLKAVKNT